MKLQIELRTNSTPFSNAMTHETAMLASGSLASITVTGLSLTGYHWQSRAVDVNGGASAWTPFGGSPDFTVTSPPNTPPGVPTTVNQFQSDGVTAIAVGTTTNQSTVVFKANVTDAETSVRLIIELRTLLPAGWTSVATHTSSFVTSGSQAAISVSGLADNSYRWRYAAEDANGATSAWTTFGGNPDTSADFVVNTATNNPPAVPTSPGQFTTSDVAIAIGGTTPDGAVVFKANVSDPDGNTVRLEVEVKPLGVAFANSGSQSALVASGSQASVTVGSLDGQFHWQYRAVDSNGAPSAWTSFGGNPETDVDFQTAASPPPPPQGGGGGGGGGGCGACPNGSPLALACVVALLLLLRR